MLKATISTINEEFEKSRVKAYTRTRKGHLERVKEYGRRGEHKVESPRGKMKTIVDRLKGSGFHVDSREVSEGTIKVWLKAPKDPGYVETAQVALISAGFKGVGPIKGSFGKKEFSGPGFEVQQQTMMDGDFRGLFIVVHAGLGGGSVSL